MNKLELVSKISEKGNLTKKDAEIALNAFIETVQETLANGEKVQLVNFGTFEVRDRAPRIGRNPKDPSQVVEIPASKNPAFKAGKSLKEAVNKK